MGLDDLIRDAVKAANGQLEPAPPLTADVVREAVRKVMEQPAFFPPPCGTEERPHLIHPRDWAEGNPWPCANMCGQIVDPKQMAGWDGPYEYPDRSGDRDEAADQPR